MKTNMKTNTYYGFRSANSSEEPAWFHTHEAAERFAAKCGFHLGDIDTIDEAEADDIMDTPESPWGLSTTEPAIDCTAKHTPGPWRMDNRIGAPHSISGGGKWIATIHCDQATTTAEIHPREKQAQANARLIASAPDLLAALERVSMWQSEKINSGEMTMGELFNITFGMVNAALAKAKGEK